MDLVSRLKQYLDFRQISVTQFADECGIPRPTASQLLAGRNKKVSDEIIGKIHQYYPSLSILWLMFGEGDMLSGDVSEKRPSVSKPVFENPTSKVSDNHNSEFGNANVNKPNRSEFRFTDEEKEMDSIPDSTTYPQSKTFEFANINTDVKQPLSDDDTFTLKTETGKKVIGIVVYYDDSTFESFIPDPEHRHPFLK